jgi:3D (Asp-Asp-Asp) domain-containing protein
MSGHENRKVYSRGLCGSCYYAARNLVKSGRATWASLIDAGVAKPTGSGTLEDRILQKLKGAKVSAVDCQKFQVGSEVSIEGKRGNWKVIGHDRVRGYRLASLDDETIHVSDVEEVDLSIRMGG